MPDLNGLLSTAPMVLVDNPALRQFSDGDLAAPLGDHANSLLIRALGGKRLAQTLRGNMFSGGTGTTGVLLRAPATTTGGLTLTNPAQSLVLVSIEKIRFTTNSTATDVIAGLLWEYSLTVANFPSAGTAVTVVGQPVGKPSSIAQASLNYGDTFAAAYTFGGALGMTLTATTSAPGSGELDLDGLMVLGPGSSVNICAAIVQTSDKTDVDIVWSEWLP